MNLPMPPGEISVNIYNYFGISFILAIYTGPVLLVSHYIAKVYNEFLHCYKQFCLLQIVIVYGMSKNLPIILNSPKFWPGLALVPF